MPRLGHLLFRRRKAQKICQTEPTSPVVETPQHAAQAPSPVDRTESNDPPPYYPAPSPPVRRGTSEEEPVATSPVFEYLDPTLNLTAVLMEQQWREKDHIFARAVVQFIADRFDGRLKGWAGYTYTYICEVLLFMLS